MKISFALTTLSVLLLSACATLTEEQQFALEDKRVLAMEQFYQAEETCQRMGGVMEMTEKRWGKRSHRDYAAAKCVRY